MESYFSECLEICFCSGKIPNIFLKLLKISLKASLFIPEYDEKQNSDELKVIIEKYKKTNKTSENGFNDYILFRIVSNSIIPNPLSIYYILGKQISQSTDVCNFNNNLITLYTGASTLISKIGKYMHIIFILDLSSLLMNIDYFKFDEFLDTWINGFLSSIENILKEVNELVCMHNNNNNSDKYKIEVKFSFLLFGIENEKSWFQMLLNEVNLLDLNKSIDYITDYLINELVQFMNYWDKEKQGKVALNEKRWDLELIEYLNSICNFYSNSIVILTNGVIISKITGEKGSSILSLDTEIMKYCLRFDIKLHFIIMEELESGFNDSSIGQTKSIDIFNFIVNSSNSMLIRTDVTLKDLNKREIALELVYSSISDLKPVCDIEFDNFNSNKVEVFKYRIEKEKISLIELVFNRINNGFKLINDEFEMKLPVFAISQFTKLVRIGSLISSYNCSNEYWTITVFIEDNMIFNTNDFELIKSKLESKDFINRNENFTKYNKKNYLIKKILYYIHRICILDNIFEIISAENSLGEDNSIKLSELSLPYMIRLGTKLILKEDKNVLFKDSNDFFAGSWDSFIQVIDNLGFKLFYMNNDFNSKNNKKTNDKAIYFKITNRMESINNKKFKDINILSVLKSWEVTKRISKLNKTIQRNSVNNYIIWLVIDRFSTNNDESANYKIKTSIVKFELLFYGHNPDYCNDYFDFFINNIKSIGTIAANDHTLGLIQISFKYKNLICSMFEKLVKTKSWSYLLWNGSNNKHNINKNDVNNNSSINDKNSRKDIVTSFINQDNNFNSQKSKIGDTINNFKNKNYVDSIGNLSDDDNKNDHFLINELEYSSLNHKIISIISHSRVIDGWSLLFKNKTKKEFCSSWFKLVDEKTNDICSESVLVYEISIGFENERNGIKLICKLYMINSLNYLNQDVINELFSKYVNIVQNQDNKIIHTTSLIEYLYKSSHLRKKEVTYYHNRNSIIVLKKDDCNDLNNNNGELSSINQSNKNIDTVTSVYYDNMASNSQNKYLINKKDKINNHSINNHSINEDDNDINSTGKNNSDNNNGSDYNGNNINNDGNNQEYISEISLFKSSKINEKVRDEINEIKNLYDDSNCDNKCSKNEYNGYKNNYNNIAELNKTSSNSTSYENSTKSEIIDLNEEFNYQKNRRIIKNKSFYGNNNGFLLTIRDISALFLTYHNLFQSKYSDYRHIIVEDNADLNKNFINNYKPLYLIEIPLIEVGCINFESFGSFSRKKDSQVLKKYIDGVSESSFEKFLYKLSKVIDKSVRVNNNEWYMILFVNDNDLFNNNDELSLKDYHQNGKIVNGGTKTRFPDFIIITHIKLIKSDVSGLKKSILGIYFCSCNNLSYGVTNKRDDYNLNVDYKKTLKIKNYIELFTSRVKDIWNIVKFKTISRYYLLGIPLCVAEIAKIQRHNEIDSIKYKKKNSLIPSVVNFNINSKYIDDGILNEKCEYLTCKINNIFVNLDKFKKVLLNKYRSYDKNSILELNKFAIYMETELKFRIKNLLNLKLIHFDDIDLCDFIIFCGLLQSSKEKSENIMIIVSLINNKNNINLNQYENKQFWIENMNGELNENKNKKLNWFHCLISYYLINDFKNDCIELKVTFYSSLDKEHNNDRLTDLERGVVLNYIREDFIIEFKKIFLSWIIDMTTEQSIVHRKKNNSNIIETFSFVGRDMLLEGFYNSKKIDWKQKEYIYSDDINLTINNNNNSYYSSSVVYHSDIQITMLKSSTKYSNYMTLFNLLSSLLDYIPLKREPNLILLWKGYKIPEEIFISNITKYKDKINMNYINDVINHMRILIEIFKPSEIMNNETLLKIRINIYLPSSLLSGKYLSMNKRFKCKLCDFKIYKGQFESIISFLFSITQNRFLDLWKDATCDFLLQNVTVSKKVSSLIIPTLVSEEESLALKNNDNKLNSEISILSSIEQNKVFGPILSTESSLYEIPYGLTPNYYKINYNNIKIKTQSKKISQKYYEKQPGKVILWDGSEVEIPIYTFWLNKYDEIYVEIPYELYDVQLIDSLFKLDNNLVFNESNTTNNDYFNINIKKLFQKKDLGNMSDNTFINLIYPKYWLLYSEDVTTSPIKLGIGSLFLVKPDYKLIDTTNIDDSHSEMNYNYYNNHDSLIKKKQKIGISLSFFGKKKPTKNTRIYFYKYLRFLIKNFWQFWKINNKKSSSGVNINEFRDYKINNDISIENGYNSKQLISLILKFNSIYYNYISIFIWNAIQNKTILFNCESLYVIIRKVLMEFGIEFNDTEKGINVNIESLYSDGNNNKHSELNNCKIHISLFSGVNGYILNKQDPWAGGEKIGGECLNLDSKLKDYFIKLNSEDINRLPNNFWDFDNILELIHIEKSDENISNNNSWKIIRGYDKKILQIQNNLPIHLLSDQINIKPVISNAKIGNNNTVYMIPCIYVGVDIDYKNIEFNEINKETHKSFRINSLIEFILSLFNIVLLESLLKFKIIIENDDNIVNYYDYYGKTIGDIHKYRENMHNFFKLIIKYRNILSKYSKIRDMIYCNTKTFMDYFSTPTIQSTNSKIDITKINSENNIKMYLPSWSIKNILMKLKSELEIFNEIQVKKNEHLFKCVVSGYTLIIHDNKDIDIMNEVINDNNDNNEENSNSYIQIKYSNINLNDDKTLINEHGWHILHYKSKLSYINLDNISENEIENWLDLLYKNDNNDDEIDNNYGNDFKIFESIFNFSGGKQRPCIAFHIHSNDDKGLLNNLLFIDVNPDNILFIGWNIPLFIKERINTLIKEYFYTTSIKVIWYFQLIIWNNYYKLHDKKCIVMFDLSSLIYYDKRIKSFVDGENDCNNINIEQVKILNDNPKICGIPLKILILNMNINNDYSISNYFKLPKDLYIKEKTLIVKIKRIKVEDIIIPNIEMGKVLDLAVDNNIIENNNLLNYPSTLNLVIKLNSIKLMKRWCDYYLKYHLWMNVFQFILDNFSVRIPSEFSSLYRTSIISQVSKSNILFRYQQIINFLKKNIENYQINCNKLFYLNKNLKLNNVDKRVYYSILVYLQNSHNNLKSYINNIINNEYDHNLLLHPDKDKAILLLLSSSNNYREIENNNINYCKLCYLYPENTSLRLLLITLFKFSLDIINITLIKKNNNFFINKDKKVDEIQCINKNREEKMLINKTWYKRSLIYYNSLENKSRLCLFSEEIKNFSYINSYNKSRYHIKYIIKELISKINDYLKEMNFIRLNYSYNSNNMGNYQKYSNENDYQISILKSILNGLKIEFNNDEFNVSDCDIEITSDIDDGIYLNMIDIVDNNISIPLCLMIKIFNEKVRIIYILSSCYDTDDNGVINNSLVNTMLNYMEILNFRRIIYDFIINKTIILLFNIWNSRDSIYLSNNYNNIVNININTYNNKSISKRHLGNLIDRFIDSIYWINNLYKNIEISNNELIMPLYKINVRLELRLTHNQIITIQNNILISNKILEDYSFRIISVPNTNNILFILFELIDKNSLIGILTDDEYNNCYNCENDNNYQILCFELPDNFVLSSYKNTKKNQKKEANERNKINLLGYENVKNEVIGLLERVHEYINREKGIQLMKIYGINYNKKNVDNIINNYFSKTLSIEKNYINSLPILKIKVPDKKQIETILFANNIINKAIYIYYKYWEKKSILRFSSFIFNSKNDNKIQNRVISILLLFSSTSSTNSSSQLNKLHSNYNDGTLLLINMYTKFVVMSEYNRLDWIFEDIKFTYMDQVKVRKYFLIKNNNDISDNKYSFEEINDKIREITNKIFNNLILKSFEHFLVENTVIF
ncbi:hypothetical protein RS030_162526 [Cryptosporidium xiaoi]|uniref:Uncharacterized protein n=1 Tax=Cryptosporidium xiaoi TaxID=659607 RepID=A0AAV9Y1H9_9CRYT